MFSETLCFVVSLILMTESRVDLRCKVRLDSIDEISSQSFDQVSTRQKRVACAVVVTRHEHATSGISSHEREEVNHSRRVDRRELWLLLLTCQVARRWYRGVTHALHVNRGHSRSARFAKTHFGSVVDL